MKYCITILILVLNFSFLSAQAQPSEKSTSSYSLKSPKATVNTFLRYLQEDDFHPAIAAKTLDPQVIQSKDKELLIIQLKQILDGSGIMIDMDEIPDGSNYVDSVSGKQIYQLAAYEFPTIYVEKIENRWYFSKKTITQIPILHQKVYPFGSDRLMNILPKMGNQKILGLHAWQHISILILVLICVLIHKILSWFFDWLIYQILNKHGYSNIAHDYIKPVARPFSILILIALLLILIPVLQLPIVFNHYTILILGALRPLFGTIMVYKIVDILGEYMMRQAAKTESTMDDQIVPIVKRVLKIFVIIIGFLLILDNLRFNITALLAGISIGGLAFALAAQDTIKNFFGSLMILFDKPFQIGDWITAGDIDGTVEEVGFRSTRVRTFRNSLITVPNGKLADMSVDNHGLRQYRRFYTTITITYDTPIHLIEAFRDGLKKIVEEHPKTRKDFYNIYFNNMSAYSLDIMFYIFLEVPTWTEELLHKEEILLDIMKLANNLGIHFAFPTQTLHMENFPGQPSLSAKYDEEKISKEKLASFIKASNPK